MFKNRWKVISLITLIAVIIWGLIVGNSLNTTNETIVLAESTSDITVTPSHTLTPTSATSHTLPKTILLTPSATPTPIKEQNNVNSDISSNPDDSHQSDSLSIPSEPTTPTSTDTYFEYLHQQQNENMENQKKCTEWANERDEALKPLKQKVEYANQKIKEEESAIDNNSQLSITQKSQRKLSVLPPLYEDASQAQSEYQAAFNSFGTCPYL